MLQLELRPRWAPCHGSSRWPDLANPRHCLHRRKLQHVAHATNRLEEQLRREEADRVNLRSEAEAPFRSLRVFFYGASVVSGLLGSLVSVPQLIGAINGARGALAQADVLQNLAIDLGAVALFGFLMRGELAARDKQIARLQREEQLGALRMQLASGKTLQLAELRGSIRAVVVAGTGQQVSEALRAAEPYREQLVQRGVFIVTVPLMEGGSSSSDAPQGSNGSSQDAGEAAAAAAAGATEGDASQQQRWVARAKQPAQWQAWFQQQLKSAQGASASQGLYVGLRMDGRVRASGQGCPPWARFAAELAPIKGEGSWTGFFDGFDGRV